MAIEPTRRLFTVDEYYRMADAGILREDDRVQLLEGEIIAMPPIGPGHADTLETLAELFHRVFAGKAHIRAQQPIHLGDRSEPEPDLVLARRWPGVDRPYRRVHPEPRDILLVVEVSDSTLDYDLGEKQLVYARHEIREYWVVDLRNSRLVVHQNPVDREYRSRFELRRGDSISLDVFPDVTITVQEILG